MNRLLIQLLLAASIVGCTSVPKTDGETQNLKNASPEQIVAQRAKARWDALIAEDYEKAYSFLSEGFRDVTPLDVYAQKRKQVAFHTKAANVLSVACSDGDTCNASISVTVETMLPTVGVKPFLATEEEPWIKQGDSWFYVPKR